MPAFPSFLLAPFARGSVAALVAAASLLVAASPRVTYAASISVTTAADEIAPDNNCSLREAIIAVNLQKTEDTCVGEGTNTIVLPAGAYILNIGSSGEDGSMQGDLDLTTNMTITGAGAASTIVDGNGLDRVFDIQASASVEIDNVTIQGGSVAYGEGGGIRNMGNLNLAGTTITGNSVGSGGKGGGIYNGGTLVMATSSIRGNHAGAGEGGGSGGGIANVASARIDASEVSGNSSDADGGGLWNTRLLWLRDSSVSDNVAVAYGGGVLNNGALTIDNSTLSLNRATSGAGGGIANGKSASGELTMVNSTISGNSSGGWGGGGLANGSSPSGTGLTQLNNVTIANNRAGTDDAAKSGGGGGILNIRGDVNLSNTIVAANALTGGTASDCLGTVTSKDYNLIQEPTGCIIAGDTAHNVMGGDPALAPLADNGGATPTHALKPGSPAIDAGNPTSPGSGGSACADIDQRHVVRPLAGTAGGRPRCDIGAFEFRFEPAASIYLPLVSTSYVQDR